ncbi:hypothetical protein KC669_04465, partial [Candidatus Dojkabacteria bacterium]|nr:hypothetical protein [Candidatus Dojkabacteria bacterium]
MDESGKEINVDIIQVEVLQDSDSDERIFRDVQIGDVTSRKNELFEESAYGEKSVFGNYKEVITLMDNILDEKAEVSISDLRARVKSLQYEIINFSKRVAEGLTTAYRQPSDSPLKVLGGIMSHDMINHSVNDYTYTLTFFDFALSDSSAENLKNLVGNYLTQLEEHMNSLQSFFLSFEKLMKGERVTFKDLIDTFPKISDAPIVYEFKNIEVENGGDGSNISINS